MNSLPAGRAGRLHLGIGHFVHGLARMEMIFIDRLFGRENTIDAEYFGAKPPRSVVNPHAHVNEVAPLPLHRGPQQDMRVGGLNRMQVAHLHARGHTAGLKPPEDDPTADFVGQRSLYAAVQRVYPALKFGARLPQAQHLVTMLVKRHAQALRAVRVTAETTVTRNSLSEDGEIEDVEELIRYYRNNKEGLLPYQSQGLELPKHPEGLE